MNKYACIMYLPVTHLTVVRVDVSVGWDSGVRPIGKHLVRGTKDVRWFERNTEQVIFYKIRWQTRAEVYP